MIDTHFHLMQPVDSESPAGVKELMTEMERWEITGGIAVQPSTYRFDNSYLLSVLQRYPERFRGVAVVPEDVNFSQLEALKKQGIIGVRMNMTHNPDQQTPPSSDFLKKLRDAGLFLQVHTAGASLAEVVHLSLNTGVLLVIDHLSNPNPREGIQQTGFKEMVAGAREGGVVIKLSAPFRMAGRDDPFKTATDFARLALDQVPLNQFVVGTDWPFINCEHKPTMESLFRWFREILPNESDWLKVSIENGKKLYDFS
jgi:predicted TIM-barrel fold metal-dependent hydrolase